MAYEMTQKDFVHVFVPRAKIVNNILKNIYSNILRMQVTYNLAKIYLAYYYIKKSAPHTHSLNSGKEKSATAVVYCIIHRFCIHVKDILVLIMLNTFARTQNIMQEI